MKYHYLCLVFLLTILSTPLAAQPQTVDLTPQADFNRPLENPHKGWYHHYYDNGVHKYQVDDDSSLDQFPGMDHLYIRLAWSFFEKEEDQYDWSRIDEVIDYWVPKGYKISFRVTAKETGDLGAAVNQKVDDVCYATPKWVRDAGAQGAVVTNWGVKHWEPVWDDPVFLEKWDDFHAAFAARYDGQPYLSYIDLGGIGDWGEGHTGFSSNITPSVEQVKAHIAIFKKHYQDAELVIPDTYLSWNKSESDEAILLDEVRKNNISIRDDSPLVDYWLHEGARDNLGIAHPDYFEAVYADHPVVLETQHYGTVKEKGDWIGKNGSEVIPDLNVSGADVLRDNIKTMHATYVGYHGYADEWFRENPDLARELTNLAGYWYTINQASFPAEATAGASLSLGLEWENKGVAPAYHPYALEVKLAGASTETITLNESHNLRWKEGEVRTETYTLTLPSDVAPGRYALRVKLKDRQDTGRDIDLALSESIKDEEGYFSIGEITVGAASPNPDTPSAQTSIQSIIGDGFADQHEGTPKGVSHEWAEDPHVNWWPPAADWNAMTAWGQVYEEANGNPATNTRVEIDNMQAWYLRESDRTWVELQDSEVEGAYYAEDFAEDRNIEGDRRREPSGNVSVMPGVGPQEGFNYHFWPKNRAEYPRDNWGGFFVTCRARLVVDDPNQPDDRAQARYVIGAGGDYWASLTAEWDQWKTNYDFGIGRFKYVASEWRTLTLCNMPESQIYATPPPPLEAQPIPVPELRVEAESYTKADGTELLYSPEDGYRYVGYLDPGESLDYRVDVAEGGAYTLNFRVASADRGGSFEVVQDERVLATVDFEATGGWETFTTLSSSPTTLAAGVQTLRVRVKQGGWNFGWWEVRRVGGVVRTGLAIENCPAGPMQVGQTLDINTAAVPSNATDQEWTYSSSTPGVASVDSNTGIVTALSAGFTTVQVASRDGGQTDVCTIVVEEGEDTPESTITLRARGSTGQEDIALLINEQEVARWSLTQTWAAYTYTGSSEGAIQVAFVNDGRTVANKDKNARIDYLVLGADTLQAEAQLVNTGSFSRVTGQCGGIPSEWLYCNGYIAYDQSNTRTPDAEKEKAATALSDSEVRLFPNPAQDVVRVFLPAHEGEVMITLTDELGRRVLQHRSPGAREISFSVQKLPPGLYQVNVQQAGQQTLRKLLVE